MRGKIVLISLLAMTAMSCASYVSTPAPFPSETILKKIMPIEKLPAAADDGKTATVTLREMKTALAIANAYDHAVVEQNKAVDQAHAIAKEYDKAAKNGEENSRAGVQNTVMAGSWGVTIGAVVVLLIFLFN